MSNLKEHVYAYDANGLVKHIEVSNVSGTTQTPKDRYDFVYENNKLKEVVLNNADLAGNFQPFSKYLIHLNNGRVDYFEKRDYDPQSATYDSYGFDSLFYDSRGNLIIKKTFFHEPGKPVEARSRETYTYDDKNGDPLFQQHVILGSFFSRPFGASHNNIIQFKREQYDKASNSWTLERSHTFNYTYDSEGYPRAFSTADGLVDPEVTEAEYLCK